MSPQLTLQRVVVYNFSALRWPRGGRHPVQLAYHLADEHGRLYCLDVRRYPLPHDVEPGVYQVPEVTVPAVACAPRCRGRWDLVGERMTWFDPTVQGIMFGIRATGGQLPNRGWYPRDRQNVSQAFIYRHPSRNASPPGWPRPPTSESQTRSVAVVCPGVGPVAPVPLGRGGLDAFRLRLAEMAGGVWPTGTITSNRLFLEILVGSGLIGLEFFVLWAVHSPSDWAAVFWHQTHGSSIVGWSYSSIVRACRAS
ncbi:MAG: hypothetical protein NZ742_04730 [Acidobacteria bacterium]|nr:hypothetical protein [Acidobacteriota bacterium]MDW7984194.1 hypothetical protein [Acidobacteriota bacterium]